MCTSVNYKKLRLLGRQCEATGGESEKQAEVLIWPWRAQWGWGGKIGGWVAMKNSKLRLDEMAF